MWPQGHTDSGFLKIAALPFARHDVGPQRIELLGIIEPLRQGVGAN
jgi:hypothetical protein